MNYISKYESPLGIITLISDGASLIGLSLEGQRHGSAITNIEAGDDFEIFCETKRWLDIYFSGNIPDFMPKTDLRGTPFQTEVWNLLLEIPYGKTVTYGSLAKKLAVRRSGRMSAQAVGGAVSRNPISIIVPCHRVVGAGGNLTGYDGGIDKKIILLDIEGVDLTKYYSAF